jgi:glycosyltransferase involved in cell wall biosynthesis
MKRWDGRPDLRLAVVTPFLDRQHGTESCIIEQIERLAFRDHLEIHLYSQRVEQVAGIRSTVSSALNSEDCIVWHKVSDIPGPHLLRYLWWFFANRFRRWLDWHSGGPHPDLVYSPGINCLDANVIVVHIVFHEFYARIRSELALRCFPLRRWPRIVHRKLYYKLAMSLERKVYVDPRIRLIAVSGLVAAQLKTHFQRTEVTVIPNAVDTLRFFPEARLSKRDSSRQAFHFSNKEFVLLLIGNDWKKKGLDTLLSAIAQLCDLPLQLLIVGGDDPSFYQPAIERLKLSDRVLFEKPQSDVLRFYAAADLYVGPSLEDAFNLPILEAMACGLPVIASVQAGSSALVQDGETGFVLRDPQDDSVIARLIHRLYTDETLRVAMGDAAARFAHANCGWEENVEKTRKFLEGAYQQRCRK